MTQDRERPGKAGNDQDGARRRLHLHSHHRVDLGNLKSIRQGSRARVANRSTVKRLVGLMFGPPGDPRAGLVSDPRPRGTHPVSRQPMALGNERASSGFSGSSMTMMSAPRPVSTPPTEVASDSRGGPSRTAAGSSSRRADGTLRGRAGPAGRLRQPYLTHLTPRADFLPPAARESSFR